MSRFSNFPRLLTNRLRRHEATLRWCLAQINYESPYLRPSPDLKPGWVVKAEPEPAPPPKPEAPAKPLEFWQVAAPCPPFRLEPDEVPGPDEMLDVAKRAEARRESRLRKLERLRARIPSRAEPSPTSPERESGPGPHSPAPGSRPFLWMCQGGEKVSSSRAERAGLPR